MNARKVVIAVLAICFVIAAMVKAAEPVHFADTNLKAVVEEHLGITNPKPNDMLNLTRFHADRRGITNLTGIEYAKNLSLLTLGDNSITDVTPLSGLMKLDKLKLNGNQINDVSPLSTLTNLTDLTLSRNQITDITPLSCLTKMDNLRLDLNQIGDISALSEMTELTNLSLVNNQIRDLTPLSGLTNIKSLNLELNQISDITGLQNMTNLTFLDMTWNQVSDISALAGLMNLNNIDMNYNEVNDISPLSCALNLRFMSFRGNQHISDISALSCLTKLEKLSVGGNHIRNVNPLAGLTNLIELGLDDNEISDISALVGKMKLTYLDLADNPLDMAAYCVYVPMILANNPGINFKYGPNPYDCLSMPPIAVITGPSSGLVEAVGALIELTGWIGGLDIEDPSVRVLYTATWTISNENWTEDLVLGGTIVENIVADEIAFTEAGIYLIRLAVMEARGASNVTTTVNNDDDAPAFVVIYEPEGDCSYVVGGGWICSPAGALLDSAAEGKASFGFFAKQEEESEVPQASTEFNFLFGDFRFKSSSYESLVVTDSTASLVGEGSVEQRAGTFKFMLALVDSDQDKLRVRIWDALTDVVTYDNQRGEADDAEPADIRGGSIVIHEHKPFIVEDFETGDFSKLPWEHAGNENWVITSKQSHTGAYSAKAGAIENDGDTTLQVTLDCTGADVSFHCKVSSESGCDYLKFYIDGVKQGQWSGEQDWAEVSFPVAAGTRTFGWTYSKDGSESNGGDTAWIDDIAFPID